MATLEELTVVLDADMRQFDRAMDRATRTTRQTLRRVETAANREGQRTGTGFTSGFAATARPRMRTTVRRQVEKPLRDTKRPAEDAGRRAAESFTTGFNKSARTDAAKTMTEAVTPALQETTRKFGEEGILAAQGWTRGVDGKIRDARGKFVSAAEQAAAGLSTGLGRAAQRTSGPLSRGLGASGRAGGQGFTAGVSSGLAGLAGVFGGVAGIAATAGAALGAGVLTASKDFEAAMNNVRAVTGAAGQDFEDMTGLAKELGSTTQFSATEAADALTFLGMAGLDARESMTALPGTLDLAAAAGMDLAEAADISTNILAGFGLEVDELAHLNDVLAEASRSSNTSVSQLGMGMKQVAPVASGLGFEIEETTAALGMLADAGIKSEQGGTLLRSAMNQLINPTQGAAEKLAELGVVAAEADGSARPLADIMRDFEAAGADASDMMKIFGVEAGPAMIALLNRGGDELEAFTGKLAGAEGAAEEMADIKMSGLAGALKTVRSAAEGLAIAVGDLGVLDMAAGVAERFGAVLQSVTGWVEEHEDVLRPVVRAVGLFAGAVAAVVGVLLAGKFAVAAVGAALGVVLSPIGLVVGALSLLTAGLVAAWKRSETFRDVVTGVWERVRDAVGAVVDWFTDSVWPVLVDGWEEVRKAAGPHVKRIVGWLKNLRDNADSLGERWGWLWDAITAPLRAARTIVSAWADGAVRALKGWIDVVAGILGGDWGRAWSGAEEVLSAAWDTLVEVGKAGLGLLWTALKAWFWELPRAVGEWLAEVAPVIWDKTRNEWVPAFLDWTGEMGRKLAGKLGEWLGDFTGWLTDDVPQTLKDNLPEWTAEFVAWADGLWGKTRRKFTEFGRRMGQWIVDQAQAMPGRLSAWTDRVVEWAGGLWGKAREKVDEFGTRFADWAEEFADELPERLEAWTEKLVEWIEGVAESLPERFDAWSQRFVEWVEEFAESLPEKLETLTEKLVEWATDAPGDTADAFEEADGPAEIEEQIENDWAPRLIAAFGRAIGSLVMALPGMIVRVGVALLAGFGRILLNLGALVWQRFQDLLAVAARLWEQIKQVIIDKATELVDGVKDKIDEMYDNTVGKVEDLYNELVGNSIWPDMVDAIIGETGRLSKGVGDEVDGMGDDTTGTTSTMAQQATRQMEQLRAAVVAAVASMQSSVARLLSVLARGFASVFAQLGSQTLRSFRGMASGLVAETSNLVRALNKAFSQFGSNTVRGFTNTVRGVSSAWSKLRQAAAAPVRYVISPVYNKGLRPVWNRVASRVTGLSPMSSMSVPSGLKEGGIVPGYQPTKKDDLIMGMRSGEGVLVPEVVRGLGAGFIDFWNHVGNRGGVSAVRRVSQATNTAGLGQAPMEGLSRYAGSIPGLARGGIVGKAQQFASTPWRHIEGRIEDKARPALDQMHTGLGNAFGRGDTFGGVAHAALGAIKPRMLDQFRKADQAFAALMGGGLDSWGDLASASQRIRRTASFLSAQRGKPYIWGGVGPGGYDCSGLTSAAENVFRGLHAYMRRHTTHSFMGAPPPGWVRGLRAPLSVGVTHAGVGHMAGTLAGVHFESRGSRGVVLGRAARGTRGFPHQFGFAPSLGDALPANTYDDGGWLMPGYTLAYNGTGSPEPVSAEPIRIVLDLEGGDEELRRRIRKITRVEGGGNVQVAFGRGARP